jgi:hypothetical protein
MQITIAERLRPYSHSIGLSYLLPGSCFQIQVFPCLIRLFDLAHSDPIKQGELVLDLRGPVKHFTVSNDLERGCLCVWGETQLGFVRYLLFSQEGGKRLGLFLEKGPQEGIHLANGSDSIQLHPLQGVSLSLESGLQQKMMPMIKEKVIKTAYMAPQGNRLSLGNHKAQDWDLVRRRLNLVEIFPVWNRLGQLIPLRQSQDLLYVGTATLLKVCEEAILKGKPEDLAENFLALFQSGFHGLLAPRLVDDHYQGIVLTPKISSELSPLCLLTKGRELIERLFIHKQDKTIQILPALPPEFHHGRFTHVQLEEGVLDIEWSKKTIRRLNFYSEKEQEVHFEFRKQIKSCRIRQRKGDKGREILLGSPLSVEKNCYYFFDNFI